MSEGPIDEKRADSYRCRNGNLKIHIPMLTRRMRGRKMVFAPNALDGEIPGAAVPGRAAVIQTLARAISWAEILETGQVKSISEIAPNLEVDSPYVTRILKQTTLAPDIVEVIIKGDEPDGLSLAKLIQSFPEEWNKQRALLGFEDIG
jgi:hypothetical protein